MEASKPVDKLPHRRPLEKREHRQQDAQRIAIEGLSFLAADDDRLERFLALSGLAPATLRQAAATPEFLLAVLEHIAADEPLLLAFAQTAALDPRSIDQAREILGGPQPEWSP
jgi:hypothetical protein